MTDQSEIIRPTVSNNRVGRTWLISSRVLGKPLSRNKTQLLTKAAASGSSQAMLLENIVAGAEDVEEFNCVP